MRVRFLALTALIALSACGSSKAISLYPVSGPLSEIKPLPVIEAKARGADESSGRLTFRLPGRVKCEGTWTSVTPKVITRSRGLSLNLRGPGGNVKNDVETVGGVNTGEIYAICSDDTKVQGQFVMGSGTTSGTGTATDTKGNVYKVLF